jgi:hypothetical protein
MAEVRLSTDPINNALISFDGRVLEFFSASSKDSARFHVAQIALIQISPDKSGKNVLTVESKYVNQILLGGLVVREEVLVDMRAMVAAVQKAMALYP